MGRQPYPLEALRKLRDERAQEQVRALAEQIARSEGALLRLGEQERARRAHEAETARSVLAERERLTRGGVSGAELAQLVEFETAAGARGRQLLALETEARQLLAAERQNEQKLREQLAQLEAEAKLVRNHEAGFHERQSELQQKSDEEAALEQWNARRH